MGSWKLSEEDAAKIRQESEIVVNKNMKYLLYNEYMLNQRKGFEAIITFISNRIQDLIDQGRVSDFTEIRARIKSAESALRNDRDKALDDVFGMEIITATEEEYNTIIRNLTPYMIKTKCKNHNKDNGYKAKHKYWTFRRDKMDYLDGIFDYESNIPMIEFQFKTAEVQIRCNTGSAKHEDYKGEKREDIQRKYDEGEFTVFNTPFMWVSEKQNGKIKMRLLSEEETLKKMYPFLNTKAKRGMSR